MATNDTGNNVRHRNIANASQNNHPPSENRSINAVDNGLCGDGGSELQAEDMKHWRKHVEQVKADVLEQVQGQLSGLLDKALTESVQFFSRRGHHHAGTNGEVPNNNANRTHKSEDGKVFMARQSILDELFEINHIRTIYHMFIAALLLFIISTLTVDFIDQGRLVLDFDLFFYAFGKLSTVIWAWLLMFGYTLLGPHCALRSWGTLYHTSRFKVALSLAAALLLSAVQACVLGLFPVYVVLHYQLPPASRFIIILEQIRFLMKSYSFVRENVPAVIKNKPKEGDAPRFPSLSSYLYFLFCPTLIYRESYPRNPSIRWDYVGFNFVKILGSLFYLYFILVRLCIPVFMNESNKPFSTRTLVLSLFHATLPGMLMLLLGFFAFLHCWLNAFAEMLQFADRMFYKDWWNSTSFANYYRTWNVVIHDWLYYYGYRDFLLLSRRKFRSAAMMSVFIVSALVHEYAFTMGFGFFYPVMFCLFAVLGVLFNFAMNDKRKNPVWNIIMWTCLFIGQGVQVCLYCLEWYAQIHCPRTGTSFWELVTPRSWSCS